jgi:hypothetical protein
MTLANQSNRWLTARLLQLCSLLEPVATTEEFESIMKQAVETTEQRKVSAISKHLRRPSPEFSLKLSIVTQNAETYRRLADLFLAAMRFYNNGQRI